MHIYDKFVFLCERKGVDEVTAYKEIPLNKGTVSLWRTARKNGEKKIPSLKIALKMAKYFDTPVAYLTGDTDDPFDKSLTHWADLHYGSNPKREDFEVGANGLPVHMGNKKSPTPEGVERIPGYSDLNSANRAIIDNLIEQLLNNQSAD